MPNMRDSSRERVIASIDKCLKNLGTDYVDVYLVHWPDRNTPFEETMSALDDVVRDGKVRFVGLSNFKLDEIEACMAVRRIDVVQYGWNMFDRRMQQEILPYCAEQGVGFMAYGGLSYGLLTGTFTEDHDFGGADWRARQGNMGAIKIFAALFGPEKFKDNVRAVNELKDVAARYGKSIAQLALRWATSHPAVSTALVGCRTVAEVEDNVGAVGWTISDADLAEIDAIFARHGIDTTPDFWIEEGMTGPELAGKVAIVTGGASGLGRGIVELFVEEGASVVIADVDRDGGEALAEELGSAAAFKPTDVADADQIQAVVDFAVERFGGLHIMCNNAGIGGSFKRFLDDDFADFDRVMKVNIFGVMVGTQRAARHMAEHGGGAIVNTTSIGGINAGAGVMAYRATKAAVIHLTRSTAVELAQHDIRVNCIAPAHIPTAINANVGPVVDRARDAAAAAPGIAARRRGSRPLPRERSGRADHGHRAAGRRRDDGRRAAALDQGPQGRAAAARRRRSEANDESHLLLRRPSRPLGRAARPVGVAAPRAHAERAPRVVTRDRGAVWVCEDRVMGRSGMPANREAVKKLQRDRARRHRRRRLPRRHPEAAARGHGPRRPGGVGDLRAALARLPDRRPRAAERVLRGVERLGGRGVQRGRPRSAVRARVPARPLARGRGRRARALRGARPPRARSSASSTSTSATRPGTGCGRRRRRPACRSASTSRAARRRSSATGSASGSRRRSRRCCRCSSTSRWRP